jgi:hypothetical protein
VTRRIRRRKLAKPSPQRLALQAWVTHVMADPVAGRLATDVIGMHRGLVEWMREAEVAHVQLAEPQRRHPFDDRDKYRVTGRSGSSDPDDPMIRLVDERVFGAGDDPERLGPPRQLLANSLGEMASWYMQDTDDPIEFQESEPLAVRLGDLIGDQVAANAITTCLILHGRLADERLRKNARQHWHRRKELYVRVLDDQPTKGRRTTSGRVQVESVGPDGERKFG